MFQDQHKAVWSLEETATFINYLCQRLGSHDWIKLVRDDESSI
jgi:hypothetical protein